MPRLFHRYPLRKGILIISEEGRFVKEGQSDGSTQGVQGVAGGVAGMVE